MKRRRSPLPKQRGIALLVAIVMFALATTVAAAITYNKAMAARRAAATFTLEQALQAGMAAEALAQIVLEDDASNNRTELHRDWAQPMPPTEIEGTGRFTKTSQVGSGKWPLPPGRYELRLLVDDGYESIARSRPFTVEG